MKNFFLSKSRFYFNISLGSIFSFFFDIIFFSKNKSSIKEDLKYFYPNSNFLYFDHGRSAFYYLLQNLKSKTKKKKILINSFTLFEMVNMIIYSGFEPIFIDNKKHSFNSNSLDLLEEYKSEIAAIVVTHLNGYNDEIFEIKEYTKNLNDKIYIIEDCAVSFGAKKNNKYAGSVGDFSILSFNIMKNITSFTGGILIINDKNFVINKNINLFKNNKRLDLILKGIFLILLKFLNSRLIFPFFFLFIRYSYSNSFNFFLKKYRTDFFINIYEKIPKNYLRLMDSSQIKLLKKQFTSFKKNHEIRIKNSRYYYENLNEFDYLIFPQTNFNEENLFIEFPIICKNEKIKKMIWERSLKKFIDIKNYYYTNCGEQEIYKKYTSNKKLSNSKFISENIIMLPVHPNMKKDDLDKIISFLLFFK